MSDKTGDACLRAVDGKCPHTEVCPLSHLGTGECARIRQLAAGGLTNDRLRELGIFEEQQIRIVSRQGNLICQVCNARLGLSAEVAKSILVEPVAPKPR